MQHSAFLLRFYYLALVLLLGACSHLLFYPSRTIVVDTAMVTPADEKITLTMHDGIKLDGLVLPARHSPALGSILFFHGNSGNISTNLHHVFWLTAQGYDVVMFDYRGYGMSEGVVNLDATIVDMAEIWRWFNHRYAQQSRFVIAHSLGAAMTTYVVAQHKELRLDLSGVVLMSGFSAYKEIMRDVMEKSFWLSWLRYPASLGMPDDYDAKTAIAAISPTPLLIIHGIFDPVVPYKHAKILYRNALLPKELLSYSGLHNEPLDNAERQQWLLQFLQKNRVTPRLNKAAK